MPPRVSLRIDISADGTVIRSTPIYHGDGAVPGPNPLVDYADNHVPAAAYGAVKAPWEPLRDRIRERLIAAVVAASPVPVADSEVADAVDDLASERPLLEWLASGGLEGLIKQVLALLKLAGAV